MFTMDEHTAVNARGAVQAVSIKKVGFVAAEEGVCTRLVPQVAVKRFMADYRGSEYWCMPTFGEELTQVPAETQLLMLELTDGTFCAVVPVVNSLWKTTLAGDEQGLCARTVCWVDTTAGCEGLALVYAVGEEPTQLVQACVAAALEEMGSDIKLRQQRQYPEILEYLGWCSWDSMQIRVNEGGIEEKCREFRDKKIPVKWAILDDMWAEIRDFYGKTYDSFRDMVRLMHSSRMYDYEADPIRFPNGLAHCIDLVKAYGLQVGMWLPSTGYWKGMDPEGPAYEKLKPYLMRSQMDCWIADWHYEGAKGYFDTLLGYLHRCGADFVKIDNQALFRRHYKGLAPLGQQAHQFHSALEDSVTEQFGGRMINCMGMAAENIWSRKNSAVSRCSDDFLPENKAWFTKHVLQCAYNSLLQGVLYWCDWDMWWTDDGQAQKNALMRAVSGGPVYVSDQLQRSRGEVLKPLALADGRVLRCDRPGMPTADCVCADPTVSGRAMKVQNMAGSHGVLAVLNLDAQENPVTTTICAEQIPGFAGETYAVYEHFSGDFRVLRRGEEFAVTLKNADDYRLYILAPMTDGFAAIGRTDKFISPKTVAGVADGVMELVEDGPCAWVQDGRLCKR